MTADNEVSLSLDAGDAGVVEAAAFIKATDLLLKALGAIEDSVARSKPQSRILNWKIRELSYRSPAKLCVLPETKAAECDHDRAEQLADKVVTHFNSASIYVAGGQGSLNIASGAAVKHLKELSTLVRKGGYRQISIGSRGTMYQIGSHQNLEELSETPVQRISQGSERGVVGSINVRSGMKFKLFNDSFGWIVDVTFEEDDLELVKKSLGRRADVYGSVVREPGHRPVSLTMRPGGLRDLPTGPEEAMDLDRLVGMWADDWDGTPAEEYLRMVRDGE